MPSRRIPSYRLHKPSGRAVVTLDGHDFYLGPYGSQQSRAEYERLVGEWLAGGRSLAQTRRFVQTVTEVISPYWRFAKGYYVKNGRPTSRDVSSTFSTTQS